MIYPQCTAAKLVKRYNTRDPWELADYLNYKIIEYPFSNRIKGIMLKVFGQVVIGVNQTMEQPLKKVVLAHEIGHAQLHSKFGYYFVLENTWFGPSKFERQADEFAAEFLLGDTEMEPEESIEQFARRLKIPLKLVKIWINNSGPTCHQSL